MYRDALAAADAQNEVLRARLSRSQADLETSREAFEQLRAQLERLRSGVAPDPMLADEPGYVLTRRALLVGATLAALVVIALVTVAALHWMPEPRLDLQGLRNFVWSLQHGRGVLVLAGTSFVALVSLPWVLVPWLGARGLHRQRRWGWTLAVVACWLFLPTPLLPAAAFGLVVLHSQRVRAVFFAPVPSVAA